MQNRLARNFAKKREIFAMFANDQNAKFSAKKARFSQSDFNFSLKTLFETNSLKKSRRNQDTLNWRVTQNYDFAPHSHSAVLRGGGQKK